MVLSPAGSTCLARCKASDVARSAFAGVTARMMALSPCKGKKANNINALNRLHQAKRPETRSNKEQVFAGCSIQQMVGH